MPQQQSQPLADDAEISFEDAMGGGASMAVPASGRPAEIDFNEASDSTPTKGLSKPIEGTSQEFTDLLSINPEARLAQDTPDDDYFVHVGKTFLRSLGRLKEDPKGTMIGAAKATGAGMASMAQAAIGGVEGLLTVGGAAMTGRLGIDKVLQLGTETMENSVARTQKIRDFASQVTKINTAPVNKQDQEMENLLMLLPEGISAAGDTVYDKTGSALAGAGTQGLLTLLTLKPGLAVKPLMAFKSKPVVQASLEGLAKVDPQGAEALAKHVEPEAPKVAADIRGLLDEVKNLTPEQVGENVVKKQAKAQGLPPVKPGFVRFYHGGGDTATGGGRFLTESKAYAQGYADKSANSQVYYIDLPEGGEILSQVNKSFDDTGTSMRSPYVHFELPEALTGELKPVNGKPKLKVKLKPQVSRESVVRMKDPEAIETTAAPTGVTGDRWTLDRGAMPGEPIAYLDGDAETSSAAIVEVIREGREGSHFEARTVGGELIAKASTPDAAARAAEKYIGITPEQAGIGVSQATAEIHASADQGPKVALEPNKPRYSIDEETGQHTVESTAGSAIAQENGPYLQIKRSDVAPAARGQGHAQEMMSMLSEEAERRGLVLGSDFSVSPDAVRVYDALKRKGFTIKENPSTINPETGNKVSNNPRLPVYEVTKAPVSEAAVETATQIFVSGPTLDSLPGGQFAKGKLKAWYEEAIRTVAPEALGPNAKMSAAVLANKIAESMNKDAANYGRSRERRLFWEKIQPQALREFMKRYESGKPQTDPVMEKAAQNIRVRNQEIYAQDQKAGIKYDPIDNYLYHVFEDGEKLADHFQAKYGAKWGDPKFTKDRSFDLYEEAIKAGFKPKFTNPEEIMLARQHASDIAQMKVELLSDLEGYGLAKKISKGDKAPPTDGRTYNYRRSPSGDGYWVDSTADSILHNAFDTKSLWTMSGIRGDIFRGAMFLKNAIVPIKLALSLFHPLHVATIDNATGMVRASKSLLSGNSNPVKWLGQMLEASAYGSKGIPFKGLWDNPVTGNRILRAYQGKLDPAKLTAVDTLSFQYMAEGGMIPEMSVQYKTGAIDSLRKAINQVIAEQSKVSPRAVEGALKATWHLPFAVIQAMGKPMFEIWIPSLKIASYLKDVATAIKTDPGLVTDKGRRLLAFRRLAKSVDNRYGEMAYSTLFWNRTVKDLAVANTLSLGWNLGFIREYGGGAMDIGQAVTRSGSLATKAAQGKLDRPLFVAFYTTQALLYGGLLTWALTGKSPQDLMDYIYPKNGNVDKDGRDERVNTMFYPREFAAITKHVEHEGLISGLGHLAANKASGVVGMVNQWASGVNSFDQEIRDPDSPWFKQVQQTLAATLLDLEPISVKASRESPGTVKDIALAVSGFSKAPKYVTQTDAEAAISTMYKKYYAPKQTPYESALLSNDRRDLRRFYEEGKIDKYGDLLDKMQDKYDLTAKEQMKLAQGVLKKGQDFNPYLTMFSRLTWQQQIKVLDQMTEEERTEYLPHANKEHVRFRYESPEERANY